MGKQTSHKQVRIQKLWRGQRVRAWVSVMRAACVEIERAHRGHRGRAVFAALRTLRDERVRAATQKREREKKTDAASSARVRVRTRASLVAITRVRSLFFKVSPSCRFEEGAVYHYHAMLCQRTFRGYYSRRYKHDFNARKAYIQSVVEKGEELRAHLARLSRARPNLSLAKKRSNRARSSGRASRREREREREGSAGSEPRGFGGR